MRIKFLNFNGDLIHEHQWARFKRREGNIALFIGGAALLHLAFWIIWHFWVAPYPIALTVPLPFEVGALNVLHDYFWPFVNFLFLLTNSVLIFLVYKKDIFASWLLIGANFALQVLALSITAYLVSFSGPF